MKIQNPGSPVGLWRTPQKTMLMSVSMTTMPDDGTFKQDSRYISYDRLAIVEIVVAAPVSDRL
jgi:hypothetical protein